MQLTWKYPGSNRVTVYECTEGGFNVVQSYSDPCTEEIFYTVCWMYSQVGGEADTSELGEETDTGEVGKETESNETDRNQTMADTNQNQTDNKTESNQLVETQSNQDITHNNHIRGVEDVAEVELTEVTNCSEAQNGYINSSHSNGVTSSDDGTPPEVRSSVGSSLRGRIETRIAVAGQRGLIRVVSLVKLRNLFTLMGCGDSINELKLHPQDSNLLLSASKDNSLRLWNLSTRRCVVIFGGLQGHRDEVLSCDFDLQAKYILSCGMDHSIKMWSLEAEGVEKTIQLSYSYKDTKPFPVLNQHFPIFSTRSIHRNYVDCVRWFGNFVLSKSCENKIFCWKPNLTVKKSSDIPDQSEVLHSFDYGNCDIWYMRFAVSPSFDAIAAGNQIGKVFLWDISEEPSKPAILSHQKCSTAIRQVCFSPDSNIMVTVSDDSTVWRWDKA